MGKHRFCNLPQVGTRLDTSWTLLKVYTTLTKTCLMPQWKPLNRSPRKGKVKKLNFRVGAAGRGGLWFALSPAPQCTAVELSPYNASQVAGGGTPMAAQTSRALSFSPHHTMFTVLLKKQKKNMLEDTYKIGTINCWFLKSDLENLFTWNHFPNGIT